MKRFYPLLMLAGALCCCYNTQAQFYHFITQPVQPPSFDTFVNTPGVSLQRITDSLQALADPNDTMEGGAVIEVLFKIIL